MCSQGHAISGKLSLLGALCRRFLFLLFIQGMSCGDLWKPGLVNRLIVCRVHFFYFLPWERVGEVGLKFKIQDKFYFITCKRRTNICDSPTDQNMLLSLSFYFWTNHALLGFFSKSVFFVSSSPPRFKVLSDRNRGIF